MFLSLVMSGITLSSKNPVRNYLPLLSMTLVKQCSWHTTIHARELKVSIQLKNQILLSSMMSWMTPFSKYPVRNVNILQVGLWGKVVLNILLVMLESWKSAHNLGIRYNFNIRFHLSESPKVPHMVAKGPQPSTGAGWRGA